MRKWAQDQATASPKGDNIDLVIASLSGGIFGVINTYSCEPRNGTFSYSVAMQDQHQRKGYASEAINLVLRYYFSELRYQKVFVHFHSINLPSLELHRKLGFTEDGRLRRMIYTGGTYHDDIILGLLVDEFDQYNNQRRRL